MFYKIMYIIPKPQGFDITIYIAICMAFYGLNVFRVHYSEYTIYYICRFNVYIFL